MAMGVGRSIGRIFYVLILPLVCEFVYKNHVQCEHTVPYSCEGEKVMLVKKVYSCSDDLCSKKLYDTPDVQDVWSACNFRNSCDVTIRQHFLILQQDCVLPDQISKGDVCAGGMLTVNAGPGKYYIHNPGYPDRAADQASCTCRANLSQPINVTMRYLVSDLPDDSLRILWDNLGGTPNGSIQSFTPRSKLELVYQQSNISSFWFQISVNSTIELDCETVYPTVIIPTTVSPTSAALLPFGTRIWIIVGASSGVIVVIIILIPIMIMFICRHRKRRAAKLLVWNEMVEKATINVANNSTTIQRGTMGADRIRKIPVDGQTVNLYQSIDESGNVVPDEVDQDAWDMVKPSKRGIPKNRPQQSLPDTPHDKEVPYYVYETLPKTGSPKKNHPYQDIEELESGEEGSVDKVKVNNVYESEESVADDHDDDWNDLYQMASTLGRGTSPEDSKWKTNDIQQFAKLHAAGKADGDGSKAPFSGGGSLKPPSRDSRRSPKFDPKTLNFPLSSRGGKKSPNTGGRAGGSPRFGTAKSPDSGPGTVRPPSSGSETAKLPYSQGNPAQIPHSSGGSRKVPYSGGSTPRSHDSGRGTWKSPYGSDKDTQYPQGTAKFPYSPPGNYDNARDLKPESDSSGYDNCEPSVDEEWLKAKEKEKADLEAEFHNIGKTLSRIKGDIEHFKTLKKTGKKGQIQNGSDVYEEVS